MKFIVVKDSAAAARRKGYHGRHRLDRWVEMSLTSGYSQLPLRNLSITRTLVSPIPKMADRKKSADVVVVGAGITGLTAAAELHRQGIDVILLESSPRVGGRVYSTVSTLGSHLDLGGQWIGHGHKRLTALVNKAGGTIYKTFSKGQPVILRHGHAVSYFSPSVILSVLYLVVLEIIARTYVPKSWISISADKAIESWVPLQVAREILHLLVSITSTADLQNYSVYSLAKSITLCDGLSAMMGTTGGAQDSLVIESMASVTSLLEKELSGKIFKNAYVTNVEHTSESQVTVITASGLQISGKKAIFTVPPPMLKSITFSPALPAERQALQRNTQMGIVYKAIAVYEKPFWRDGLGGELLLLDDPACGVFDTTAPDGPGHLCFLVTGTPAHRLDEMNAESRREFLLSRLEPHLGPQVREPHDWRDIAWHQDKHCGGGYIAFPFLGTTEGTLPMPHSPIRNLHWAGTETAQDHPGYIEGAIQSSERAVREVVEALTDSR